MSLKKSANSSVERQIFMSHKGEVMGPVTAFRDHIGFLPSLPATATLPLRTLGYNHALVEMVLQGRTFLEQFAKEHTHLVQQVSRLDMAHELGNSAVDDVLAGVAAEKNAPIPGVVPPMARWVAASAGDAGTLAVDATSSPLAFCHPSMFRLWSPLW